MRFVLAIVLFVCAFAAVGLGIAQRTVLAGPDELVASADVGSAAPVTLIDGATLTQLPGNQTLTVSGDGDVFVAYGRTVDVLGWIGDARYNEVTFDAETSELSGEVTGGSESAVPSPEGSDLWLAEKTGTDTLAWGLNLPASMSVIVVGEPDEAAPGDIRLRWPLDNSAPASFWLIVGGLILLVLGLVAFIWALVHERRRRGPRRKQPRLPRAPRPPRLTARSMRALPAVPERGRRRTMAVATLTAGALLLPGCSAIDGVFGGGAAATPSPSVSATAEEERPVAVTPRQLDAILDRATSTIADADAGLSGELAATRLSGPALEQRVANYALRTADGNVPPEAPIPSGKVEVMLPQAYDKWPRAVFAVVSDPSDTTVPPMALMLVQDDARSQYRIDYTISLQPGADVPALAPKTVGAPLLGPDTKLVPFPPDQLATAYGDVLLNGEASEFFDIFSTDDDFRDVLVADKAKRKGELSASAALAFSNQAGDADTIVFGTSDAGAIVATELNDIETVTPAEAGAAINPTGSVKLLSGKDQTTKGIIATYGLQLLFYVPRDANDKVVLLGGTQSIISATEVP